MVVAPNIEIAFGHSVETVSKKINQTATDHGFWPPGRNIGECIALIHSELSEALEATRKDLESDHLPGVSGVAEELADATIRIFDLAYHLEIDLGDIILKKMTYNETRPYLHGKKF